MSIPEMLQRPGTNVIKLFTVVIYNFCDKLECFFHGKFFQPGLKFVVRAKSLAQSEAFKMGFTWIGCGLSNKH
jgi:hypothetical protein